jgi:ABC-type transport system involved in cytochrome bd biosynthesis fused ATPase/permease subunit
MFTRASSRTDAGPNASYGPVQTADRIYVIQNGRVVQQGTFPELSEQEGLFARMMARQML